MLTKQNSGMFLSNQWHKERALAMRDRSVTGDYNQEDLKLTDEDIGGKYNPDIFKGITSPIDAFTESKEYDMRNSPTRGGKE